MTRLEWQVSKVVSVREETPHAKTLVLEVPAWAGHRAGQHVDIRLVAEDGYRAERSYSIASAPENASVELTIERLGDGEVSPYLCDVLHAGDGLEVRGPIGGYFVWSTLQAGPLLLIAGGSGIVPLMAMLRHRGLADPMLRDQAPTRVLYSARTWDDVIYKDELRELADKSGATVTFTLTREVPSDWRGLARRVDRAMLEEVGWPASDMPNVFVCGPTPFVEAVATLLVELGHEPSRVRTERFGPTG
ncbi:MAG TPA: ferredoxin reductase [Gemmatimonadaceae bacterium]